MRLFPAVIGARISRDQLGRNLRCSLDVLPRIPTEFRLKAQVARNELPSDILI